LNLILFKGEIMSCFKKGDVVRYKKNEICNMQCNGHGDADATKEFIVESNDYEPTVNLEHSHALIKFKGYKTRCFAHRLELVKEAHKKKKPEPEGNFAWGVFCDDGKIFSLHKTRRAARDAKQGEWYSYTLHVKKIKYEIV